MLQKVRSAFPPARQMTDWAALYTHLSREDYLSAAYLWLVARVVKQGLSSMDEGVKAVSPFWTSSPVRLY